MKYALIFVDSYGISHVKDFDTIKDAQKYLKLIGYTNKQYIIVKK